MSNLIPNITLKRNNELFVFLLVLMVFPPFLSALFALSLFIMRKDVNYGILFSLFFVLFLVYNFFSIDNYGRFESVVYANNYSLWYTQDPLNIIIKLGISFFPLQCLHFFYFYIFLVYVFWLKSLANINGRNFSFFFVVIFITTLTIRNSMDLLYYTLSVVLGIYILSTNNSLSIKKVLLLVLLVYICHPGFFLILLPALFIYYMDIISRRTKNWIYFMSLIFVYVMYYLIGSSDLIKFSFGIPFLDSFIEHYNNYNSSNAYWGKQVEGFIAGGYFRGYVIPLFDFGIFILSLKYRKSISNPKILSLFQAAMLFYPNFFSFNTFSERCQVVLSITSIIVLIMLVNVINNKFFSIRNIALYSSFIFIFNLFYVMGAVSLSNVFKQSSDYQTIQRRSYVMPSVYLFNFEDFGYSDVFLLNNKNITF